MKNSQVIYKAPLRERLRMLRNHVAPAMSFALVLGCFFAMPDISVSIVVGEVSPMVVQTETTTVTDSECGPVIAAVGMGVSANIFEPVKKPTASPAPVAPAAPVVKRKARYEVFSAYTPPTTDDAKAVKYIKRYYKAAIRAMENYGQPASVKLAQGLLESGTGESTLATTANNHFGIKCFAKGCKKGHCVNHHDDSAKDFFVIYRDAGLSYDAHGRFLLKKRYKPCHKVKTPDEWCDCLKAAGYATDPAYATKLKNIMRKYNLYEFDYPENHRG